MDIVYIGPPPVKFLLPPPLSYAASALSYVASALLLHSQCYAPVSTHDCLCPKARSAVTKCHNSDTHHNDARHMFGRDQVYSLSSDVHWHLGLENLDITMGVTRQPSNPVIYCQTCTR